MSEDKSKKVLCKYFLNGACRKGSACDFSHDRNDAPSKVCTFYLQGSCSFGNKCRYDHVKSKNEARRPPPPLTSEVNNGASSSGLQKLSNNKLTYNGQEFVPGQFWTPPAPALSYSKAAQTGLSLPETVVTCEHCSKVISPEEENHLENCLKFQEMEMENAFKAQASSDKTCGICLEVVWDKQPDSKKRFGILSHCNHVYCLECIRTWRCKETSEAGTSRLCPECRTRSDFVLPSYHWFSDDVEKGKMISDYKEQLNTKKCRYFSKDQFCKFGEKCFYLHLNPDGSKGHNNKRRMKENADGLVDLIDLITISEFIEAHLNDYNDDDDDDDEDYFDYFMFQDTSSDSD